MQSKKLWVRVALWGALGFPALIGQADVALAQRLVTTGNTSSLGACAFAAGSSNATSTSIAPNCTLAAAAAEGAAFTAQSVSVQSANSVLNRLSQIRQIGQASGGTAATPETGGTGGATSTLTGGQPTSLSGAGIGGGGGQAAGGGAGGGGGQRAGTGGGAERR